jgi:hypothetical protein
MASSSGYNTRSKGKAEELPSDLKRKPLSSIPQRSRKRTKLEPQEKESSHSGKREENRAKEPEILEKGLIYFFYRPKVDSEEVKGIEDVAKLYLLLSPQGFEKYEERKAKKRMIAISKKKLPQFKDHGKYWGFIVKASDKMEDITNSELEEKEYSTKTRGVRHIQNCRPAGHGVYALVTHEEHTHLVYVLEQPTDLGPVQKAFNIEKEGSYVIQVKNPDLESGWGTFLRKEDRAKYPPHLAEMFTGKREQTRKWHPANPAELLDFEGVELLFIGATEDIVEELGETGEYIEHLEEIDAKRLTDDKLFQELHLDKKKFHPDPLLEGIWK